MEEEFIPLKPGDRIVRGPDWDWGDQDGGAGNIGIVADREALEGWIAVDWPNGTGNAYRCEDIHREIQLAPIIKEVEEVKVEKKFPPVKRMGISEFKDVLKNL